ncbi:MAG: hypothetical protein ABJI60_21220 [Kangiellaceae bacterium]
MKTNKYLVLISVSLISMVLGSCGTSLTLPATSSNMERVYLIQYDTWGHHSLAFFRNGKLIEFTYGDWELFALNKRDLWTGWKNMTFPTEGALGKKIVGFNEGDSICSKFIGCNKTASFQAPSHKVSELLIMLEESYLEESKSEVYNSLEEVFFVKHKRRYWLWHNCNHQLVEWLEYLGAKVSGRILFSPNFIE